MEPKVSVIIFTYNNTQYLRKCFDSVLNQTLKDIEIFIADDGSTDPEAVRIIDEYAAKDGRVILDRHRNIGCGASANRCLDKARGTYVTGIDSDDEYELNALETLWALTRNGTADVVKGTYTVITEDGEQTEFLWDERLCDQMLTPMMLRGYDKLHIIGSPPCLWCGIYRRQFMIDNGIRWRETPGALYQDTAVTLKLKIAAENMLVTNQSVYRYTWNNPNASTKVNQNFLALAAEYDDVESWCKARRFNVWDILGAVRWKGMLWFRARLKDEQARDMCMAKTISDMASQYIRPDYYSESDLEYLRECLRIKTSNGT